MKPHIIALLLLGALFAACSNEKIVEEPQPSQAANTIQFVATLAPKSEGSSRAITTGEDGEGKEFLNVSWKKDEEIAICYQTNSGWERVRASVQSVDKTTGVATIKATLTNITTNTEAKFIYPYWLATSSGEINMDKLQKNQSGLLNTEKPVGGGSFIYGIDERFDLATGTGILSVNGDNATVSSNIGMKNEVCICKFNLTLENPNEAANFYDISIAFEGGYTYTLSVVPKEKLGGLYVAMLPVSSATATIIVEGYADNIGVGSPVPISRHSTFISNVELVAGKFYRNVPVTLTKGGLIDLLQGSVTAGNFDVITSYGAGTGNTITIPDGYTVTLFNVNIFSGNACIACLGDATIILEGTNSVKCDSDAPGIQPGPSGKTLTIRGSGSLTATGGVGSAGIGSGNVGSCGDITITGGTITATGGDFGAGIGCGLNSSCGNITITNTVTRVTAHKGFGAPYSIGRGRGGSTCGTITIGGTTYYNGANFENSGEDILSQSPYTYEP